MEENLKEKSIYTIATAHLDTSWLWDLETTIRSMIPATLNCNFKYFEKYPDYVFNFEGSYRYELMEEYYPELFETLKKYVDRGNWVPCGSSFENGDVNTPSPEAIFRNILYGNSYFAEKFGKRSNDIYLPDCFGFGWALPSIAAHANLKGFTTQKLGWGSVHGRPFELGKWTGVDGKQIYALLNPGSYTTSLKNVRTNEGIINKLNRNLNEYDLPMATHLHGIGDRGGAPGKYSVKAVMEEHKKNCESDIKVLSSSTVELFEDMDTKLGEAQKEKLPEWKTELLLKTHGVGSYTSRAVGHRWNRKNEQLADAAERSAVTAMNIAGSNYPSYTLEKAWKRVLSHHFHDDITGTSFSLCYKRNWNDYVQSLNQFTECYRAASDNVAQLLDTSFVKGTAVIVNNPLQSEGLRREAVSCEMDCSPDTPFVQVFNSKGEELPSQISRRNGGKCTVTFIAGVPSVGYAAFDVRASKTPCSVKSNLKVTENTIENDFIKIAIDNNGDISSCFDKVNGFEALKSPVRLAILDNVHSKNWPAWEIMYEDIIKPARAYAVKSKIKILENGPARAVVSILKKGGKSTFIQKLILEANADMLRVENSVDWCDTASLLKLEFPLSVSNDMARYDIGIGSIERANNTPDTYEVPAQMWADISSPDGSHGVSVFSDSRSGWDKPDSNTLRLTCIHTPISSYRWECSQHLMDLGLNRFAFGIYPHKNSALNSKTNINACNFNQPMNTFISSTHKGVLPSEYSYASISEDSVIIRAMKKSESSDELIIRVQEVSGNAYQNVKLSLGNEIAEACEVFASEEFISKAKTEEGSLLFNISPFEPKTFSLKLKDVKTKSHMKSKEIPLDLFYNTIAITSNTEKELANTTVGLSIPRELIPPVISCGNSDFNISGEKLNAVMCNSQEIRIPKGAKSIKILCCALKGDSETNFYIDNKPFKVKIASAHEAVGAWDLIALGETGYIKKDTLAFTASHTHSTKEDIIAKQWYLFVYDIPLSENSKILRLPINYDVMIFAANAVMNEEIKKGNELYDSLEKRPFSYKISQSEYKYSQPPKLEKKLRKYLKEENIIYLETPFATAATQFGDIFYAVRMFISKKK